jgi:hypothetical protein
MKNFKLFLPVLLSCFLSMAFLTSANATVRTFQFNGTILTSGISGISFGDPFVATLMYDDQQSPTSSGTGYAVYGSYTYSLTVSGQTFNSTFSTGIDVTHGTSGNDAFQIDGNLQLLLYANTNTVFTSTALPTTLSLADFPQAHIAWVPVSTSLLYGVITSITSITASPTEAIEALIEQVEGLGIHHGIENSLISKLENAVDSLENGNTAGAVVKLNDFINEVKAQSGKKINETDANDLITAAQAIIDALQSSIPKGSNVQALTSSNIEPQSYGLDQNFPNPFNPTTVIRYALPEIAHVSLIVYDILGRQVAELVNSEVGAGYHQVEFNASKLSSGMYFYKLTAGNFVQINKMLLLK